MPIIASAENRTLLDNIRWDTFVELSEQRQGSVPRMTYDRGLLELMSPGLSIAMKGSILAKRFEKGETSLIKQLRASLAT